MDARPPSRTALLIWMIFSQLMALASLYPLLYMAGSWDPGFGPDEVAAATSREDLEAAREFLEPGA